MKKITRCKLCGAKLKGDLCSECGYNNAAFHYKVNSSDDYCSHSSSETFYGDADHDVHGSGFEPEKDTIPTEKWNYADFLNETQEQDNMAYEGYAEETPIPNIPKGKKEKKKKKRLWLVWLILLFIFVYIIPGLVEEDGFGSLGDTISDVMEEIGDMVWNKVAEKNPEKTPDTEMTDGENVFEKELSGGNYVAGVHIPVGLYEVQYVDGSGDIFVKNMSSSQGYIEYEDYRLMSKASDSFKVTLDAGQRLEVAPTLKVKVTARNTLGYLQNVEKNTKKTSYDIINQANVEEGTYDLQVTAKEGYAMVCFKTRDSYAYEEMNYFSFYSDDIKDDQYQNLHLKDGDLIFTVNCVIKLTPSEYDLSGFIG